MRGQLRQILSDISSAVGISGAASHAAAFDRMQTALADLDSQSDSDLVNHVEAAVNDLVPAGWKIKLQILNDAGLAEQDFLRALDSIKNDVTLKKNDLLKIAEVYVGYVEKRATREKLLDAIRTRFYGKVYDRDADEMAKRATPW